MDDSSGDKLSVFAMLCRQVVVLLQRPGVLWQSASTWDDHDLWTHTVEVRVPDDAQTTAGQVPCREGQNAAGKTDPCTHPFSTVNVRLNYLSSYIWQCVDFLRSIIAFVTSHAWRISVASCVADDIKKLLTRALC